ncbi:MAG: phosphotransferase, partial [Propionibacteriaceae bacterium]
PDGERCAWANWISPSDVVTCCEHAAQQLRRWGFDELGASIVSLAKLTAEDHVLPTQVVHGDFWDNNIYIRDEQLIAVTDFDFLGRRPRIDDLALMLYFADEQPYFDGSGPRSVDTRIADIVPLVRSYADHLTVPLTTEEVTALPIALARQPLWTYGKWLLRRPEDPAARRDALDTSPAVSRALEIMTQPDRWAEAFSSTT